MWFQSFSLRLAHIWGVPVFSFPGSLSSLPMILPMSRRGTATRRRTGKESPLREVYVAIVKRRINWPASPCKAHKQPRQVSAMFGLRLATRSGCVAVVDTQSRQDTMLRYRACVSQCLRNGCRFSTEKGEGQKGGLHQSGSPIHSSPFHAAGM